MDPTDLLGLLKAHNYLPVFLLVVVYMRKIFGPTANGFPPEIDVKWQPVLSGALGAIYGGLVAATHGAVWYFAIGTALCTAGVTGLGDGILTAIFADPSKAPRWAKLLVFVWDHLPGFPSSGGGGGSAAASKPWVKDPAGVVPTPPPSNSNTRRSLIAIGTACFVIGVTACGAGQIFGPGSPIPTDAQALANCVTTQLLSGNTNPLSVAGACQVPEDEAFVDLWGFIVKALAKDGKISPAKAAMAESNGKMARAKVVEQ